MAHLRITNELKSHHEGVIVRCGEKGHSFVVVDSSYDISKNYESIEDIGKCFTVYDSAGKNGGDSNGGINFNESWSCRGLKGYKQDDFSTISEYFTIN